MSGRGRQRLGPNAFGYSGRGRPRTKELPPNVAMMDDRPLPPGIVLGDPLPGTEQFRNRMPRVGSQFQMEVAPKSEAEYASTRPLPDLVCQDYPHLTLQEWQEYEEQLQQSTTAQTHDWPYVPPSLNNGVTTATTTNATTTTSPCSASSPSNSDNDDEEDPTTDRPCHTEENNHHHDDRMWKTQRGGLLVCPSSSPDNNNRNGFWAFVQPLLLPGANLTTATVINNGSSSEQSASSNRLAIALENTASNNNTDTPWEHQMLEWHQQQQNLLLQIKQDAEEQQQQLPKRRGRKPKRKATDLTSSTLLCDNVFDWYSTQIMSSSRGERSPLPKKQRQDDSNQNTTDTWGNHEEEAEVLQHLWLHHGGQTSAATLETMVQLSAGKACMAQKVRRRELKRQPSSLHPAAQWRLHLRRSILAPMGDFRDTIYSTKAKYPYPTMNAATMTTTTTGSTAVCIQSNVINDEDSSSNNNETPIDKEKQPALSGVDDSNNMDDRVSCISDQDDPESVRAVWKAVLAFGKIMEEQLSSSSGSGSIKQHPPRLSVLLSFLQNASEVRPLPEDCFRAPSVPPEINNCLSNILEHVVKARLVQAQLLDLLAATNDEGVDFEALSKFMDQSGKTLAVQLEDAEEVYRQLGYATDWQLRLDALVAEPEVSLMSLEALAQEARGHSFRSKGLVQLEGRIQRAYQLRDRIVAWQESWKQGVKESVKFVSAIVRDANRLKLSIPEVSELLQMHRSIEAWIDRANIAIRSRISLTEVRDLIQRGKELPVDLSEYMDKLESRVCLADEWLDRLKEIVPCEQPCTVVDQSKDSAFMLQWMRLMRKAVNNGEYNNLHGMASEGSRIPVEVECVNLLQVELDAKNWTAKAKRWIPNLPGDEDSSTLGKKGKVDDLREHLEKAAVLRERLALPEKTKKEWMLDGEKELQDIVDSAENWYSKYKPYLDWDNRRSDARSCLSIRMLGLIVDEGDAIFANLGSLTAKMQRILAQAESWITSYKPLLVRCNIIPKDANDDFDEPAFVTIPEMTAASTAAAADISLDLDEAVELQHVVKKVKDWGNRALAAAPKRSKRQGRTRKLRFTVDDIISLIHEASDLPVDTVEEVNRLQIQLSDVQEWREKARVDIGNIASGFRKLRDVVDEIYGKPSEFSRRQGDKQTSNSSNDGTEMNAEPELKKEKETSEEVSVVDETSSIDDSEQDTDGLSYLGNGRCNVNQLIKAYKREAASTGVISGEAEVADRLEAVSRWCVRSLKYLDTQRDVFDKRFFGAFDRFVAEGRELSSSAMNEKEEHYLEDKQLGGSLSSAWGDLIADQLQRLEILLVDRARFVSWCDTAEGALFSRDKQPTMEKIILIADESKDFPSVCDVVQKVRGLYNKATEWVEAASELIKSDEKMSQQDAKCIITEGEKLGFVCNELKELRNALKASRGWAARVKKCKVDQGAAHINDVQELIDEHDSLLIEMPEELEKLKSAMKSYCICRRPYAGFMIGCDECEEWYHGHCIGITESRADKVDKYVCVRCSVERAYKTCAATTAGIIKKWTCPKELKKARQVDAQRHQRKVRKETKEIEKLQGKIQAVDAGGQEVAPNSGIVKDKNGLAPIEDEGSTTVYGESGAGAEAQGVANEVAAIPVAPVTTSANTEQPAEESENASGEKKSDADVQATLVKAAASIVQCKDRLSVLHDKAVERKRTQALEDSKSELIRYWCLRVRSLVVPETEDVAEKGRPEMDGSLSPSMACLVDEAKKLGIIHLADVDGAVNALKCMTWALQATSVLARKPSLRELGLLISQSSSLRLPDEKALRMIKSMVQRASVWQSKVLKALEPIPGETKDFDKEILKELAEEDIPIHMPEESLLHLAMEDNAARHCVCGGPSDGRFMLSCDKCELWFHGPCVNMTTESSDELHKWICPPCSDSCPLDEMPVEDVSMEDADAHHKAGGSLEKPVEYVSMDVAANHNKDRNAVKPAESASMEEADGHKIDHSHDKHDVSPEAPDPRKMWPPFGLMGTAEAQEALGEECCAIPNPGKVHFDVTESSALQQPIEYSDCDEPQVPDEETSINPVGYSALETTSVLGAVISPTQQQFQLTSADQIIEAETTKPGVPALTVSSSVAVAVTAVADDSVQPESSAESPGRDFIQDQNNVSDSSPPVAPVDHSSPGAEDKMEAENTTPPSHGFVYDTSVTSGEATNPMDFSYTKPNGLAARFNQDRKPAVPFLLTGPLSSPVRKPGKWISVVGTTNVTKDRNCTISFDHEPSLVSAARRAATGDPTTEYLYQEETEAGEVSEAPSSPETSSTQLPQRLDLLVAPVQDGGH